jgi:hypothetical protein
MEKFLIFTFAFICCFQLGFAQIDNPEDTTTSPIGSSLDPDTPLQEDQLPPQVASGFHNRNPEIEHATWYQNGENYAATFEKGGETLRSEFNYDGTWIGDYRNIDETEIPGPVKQQLDKDYQGYQIEEAFSVETEEGIMYQFSVSDGMQENTLRFDSEGNEVEIAESMNNKKMED